MKIFFARLMIQIIKKNAKQNVDRRLCLRVQTLAPTMADSCNLVGQINCKRSSVELSEYFRT